MKQGVGRVLEEERRAWAKARRDLEPVGKTEVRGELLELEHQGEVEA